MLPPLPFPDAVTEIHGRLLPERATPAGYAALIAAYGLAVPPPCTLYAIGLHHRRTEKNGWRILTPRHAPPTTLEGHLTFALKYEGLDLAVLKTLFRLLDPALMETMVRAKPTGRYVRRLWFLYEGLTGRLLDLPPLKRGSYVDALDAQLQYPGKAVNSPRHRVRNNMPGSPSFCPLVFRSEELEAFCQLPLAARAAEIIRNINPDSAPILLAALAMGEIQPGSTAQPTVRSAQSWQEAYERSHTHPLTPDMLAAATGSDASASLLSAMKVFSAKCGSLHPVIEASCLGFGYAGVSRKADPANPGYRFVIQHTLAHRRFAPDKHVLPVSMVLLQQQEELRPLLGRGGALFDATPHAEFLARCIKVTIEVGLPGAVRFAEQAQRFALALNERLGVRYGAALRVFEMLQANSGRVPASLARRCRKGSTFTQTAEDVFSATMSVTS